MNRAPRPLAGFLLVCAPLAGCASPGSVPVPSVSVPIPSTGPAAPTLTPQAAPTPSEVVVATPAPVSTPSATQPTPAATRTTAAPATTSGSGPLPTDLRGTNAGLVKGYDASSHTLTVDVVIYKFGAEATKYVVEHKEHWRLLSCGDNHAPYSGGSTQGCYLLNDYIKINDNPQLRKLTLADSASIQLINWKNCCTVRPTSESELAQRAKGSTPTTPPLLASFDVAGDGRVTSVSEIFTP